jgi:hypothetical protein
MSSLAFAPNSPRQTAAPVNAPTVPTQIIVGDGGDSGGHAASSSPSSSSSSSTLKSNSLPPPPSQDGDSDTATEQIIEKISKLQDLENQKYDDLNILLASNPTPDNIAQQKVLMNDITQLTNIRSQLFDTLLLQAQNNLKVNHAMNANVQDKHTIVTLKENDLNARRSAVAALNQDFENTQKMVDINVYYKKQYEARVKIMKYIVVLCFLVIFFVVLMNLGWLPQEMVIVLVVIIILAGGLYIGSLMYDAYQRSSINYDEYDWGFDSQKMASTIAKQPRHKKPASRDRTCGSGSNNDNSISSKLDSAYKSVSSSAASIEDSIQSSSSTMVSDLSANANTSSGNPLPPAPSASSSSISAASTATAAGPSVAAAQPSVQSKVSESFMLSKVPKKYFSEHTFATPFTMEDNYGRI